MLILNWLRRLERRCLGLASIIRPRKASPRRIYRELRRQLERLEERICLSVFYDFDVIAQSDQDGIASLGQFPSINDNGYVAFLGSLDAGGEAVFFGDGTLPATNLSGVGSPNTTYLASVQINDSGLVLASQRNFSPNFRSLKLWDINNPGTSQSLAGSGVAGTSILTYASMSNEANALTGEGIVFGAITAPGEPVTVQRPNPPFGFGTTLADYSGPGVSLKPMMADNGTFVYRVGNSPTDSIVIVDSSIVPQTIASSPEFSALGSAPGISDDGTTVVFVGDRGNGMGIFASIEVAGTRQLIRVAGENSGPVGVHSDLGFSGSGAAISFSTFDFDSRVGVVHQNPDPNGLADDAFIVSFLATPSQASRLNPAQSMPLTFTDQLGLWTSTILAEPQLDSPTNFNFNTSGVTSVIQVGETVSGQTVTGLTVYDPIASVRSKGGVPRSEREGDHQLAFQATTNSGTLVVRARHLDSDEDGLLDHWETSGVDVNQDGLMDLDLPAMGADPLKRDLFLEIDQIADRTTGVPTNWSNGLAPGVTAWLVGMFSEAPGLSNGIQGGINLHIDAGSGVDALGNPLSQNMGSGSLQGGDAIGQVGSPNTHIDVVYFGLPGSVNVEGVETRSFDDIKRAYFSTTDAGSRELAFRYVVLADFHSFIETAPGSGVPYTANVASAGNSTLISNAALPAKLPGHVVKIVSGTGAGQLRGVLSVTGNQITVRQNWAITPDSSSQFTLLNGSSGLGETFFRSSPDNNAIPGNDLLMTLGGYGVHSGGWLANDYIQERTLAHELGHTLGLRHGGTDHGPYKGSNYLSLMSYSHQLESPSSVLSYSGAGDPTFNDWANLKLGFQNSVINLGNTFGLAPSGVTSDEVEEFFTIFDYETLNNAPVDLGEGTQNSAPTAHAGGPYHVSPNGSIQLDGTGSNDPDEPASGLIYRWDLDGDAIFGETGSDATRGDETGVSPTFLAMGLPESSLFDVFLEVTDSGGLTGTVQAEIQIGAAPPSVTLTVSTDPLDEAAGMATVDAILSAVSDLDVTVSLAFTGTATNGTDYTRSGIQIVIPAGLTTGSITLTAVQDALDEADETIIVDIIDVTNGTEFEAQQIIATIIDDEVAPPVAVNDTAVTDQNMLVSVAVLANDSAGEGVLATTTLAVATGPSNGTVSVDLENRRIRYQPNAGFVGTDTFTYSIQNDGGASATGTVTITVEPPVLPQMPGLFSGAVNYRLAPNPSGYQVNSVILQDVSGDSVPDIVIVNGNGIDQISTLIGRGDGTFSDPISSSVPEGYSQTAAPGDFNGDGKLDLLVGFTPTDYSVLTIELLVGQGDGTFVGSDLIPLLKDPMAMVAKDVNGDGNLDAVVLASGGNRVGDEYQIGVLLGQGDGSFSVPITFSTSNILHSILLDDFNGDGKLDLAASVDYGYETNGAVRQWSGNGNGTFQQPVEYALTHPLWAPGYYTSNNSLASGDFNGDGKLDLAASTAFSDHLNFPGAAPGHYTVNVLFANSDDTFQPAIDFIDFYPYTDRVDADSYPLVTGDFNGDGKTDLAAGGFYSSNVNVAISSGEGLAPTLRLNGIGSGVAAMATGDLNGDGKADLVTANENGAAVAVLLASTDGRFSRSLRIDHDLAPEDQGLPLTPRAILAADLNGDQHTDLVLSTPYHKPGPVLLIGHLLSTVLSNGDGTFRSSTPTPSTEVAFTSMAISDVDGDQIPDIMGADAGLSGDSGITYSTGSITVMHGNGDGTFAFSRKISASDEAPLRIVSGDFNKDGKTDFATTSLNNGEVYVRLGNGNGTFQSPLRFGVGPSPLDLAITDFDNDGNLDLVTADLGAAFEDGGVTVLFGNGDGSFVSVTLVSETNISGGVRNNSVAIADFNEDGFPDIVSDGYFYTDTGLFVGQSVWLNNGDGTFQSPIESASENGSDLQTGDFNDDGMTDLMVVGVSYGTLFMIGNGDGSFRAPIYYATDSTYGQCAALADFSGDGRLDIVLPSGRLQLEVLLGAAPTPSTNAPPVAVPDFASAIEAAGVANNTIGSNATGNVLSNDTDVDVADTKAVSAVRIGATVGTIGVGLNGSFGLLTINANGTFNYAVNNANASVEALRRSSDTLTELFHYTVRDAAGATDTAVLTITITGANDSPISNSDSAAVDVDSSDSVTGNVLANDTDTDASDTQAVSGVRAGLSVGTVGSELAGSFGTLTLNVNGTFTYEVNSVHPLVEALNNTSETLTEIFEYTISDMAGATDSTTLTIIISGTNAPDALQLSLGGPAVSWVKKHPAVVVFPLVSVTGTNLGGGTLTLSTNAIGTSKKLLDVFGVPSLIALGSSIGPRFANGQLTLQIQLSDNPTSAAIQSFLRGLTFATRGKGMKTLTRTVNVTLTDGAGLSRSVSQTVNVRKKM